MAKILIPKTVQLDEKEIKRIKEKLRCNEARDY